MEDNMKMKFWILEIVFANQLNTKAKCQSAPANTKADI
ncbi:hypothetical protein T03_326 [Trichinella britovi]|uniref:Uncharacterized protein n=1 Tax=Trichinella britovi TaxID=45882 RepID=A0A0V1C5E5_TRIBR|nr:hypothetical protein T03_326 [Trichinella britovi]